ncbi:MAG: Crp/Fnr family transcriptional regulator [Sorangiineae bacterium]|nr:Crp/Fnr family transcriptional regulator [Polyangiaceae bacterium]MEB2322878.1 Crp/Fnr family transcriptional regulator [Sorangiineae bacterium]
MDALTSIKDSPVFSALSPRILDELAAAATYRTYQRGRHLWHVGERPMGLAVIASGYLKIVQPGPTGKTAICAISGKGEVLGDLAVLAHIPSRVESVFLTDGAATLIPAGTIETLASREASLALALAAATGDKVMALYDAIDALAAGRVDERVATELLKLDEHFGSTLASGARRVPVPLQRHELAELTATTPETATRVMVRWQNEGVVLTDDEGFTLLDVSKLRKIAGFDAHAEASSVPRSEPSDAARAGAE